MQVEQLFAGTEAFHPRQQPFNRLLLSAATIDTPTRLYAKMLASLQSGEGAMPAWLGLSRIQFEQFCKAFFPLIDTAMFEVNEIGIEIERTEEADELESLFSEHAKDLSEQNRWAAIVLVTGCMGGDHLWQDMGFWSRQDLSDFITLYFPSLAAKNTMDMKWKKFFYKQLCQREGIYTCRAPSCQVCVDYKSCFGPE